MKFEKTEVWGFEHAIRGMRNALESWAKSDSSNDNVGVKDMTLMQNLIRASMKETNSHSKFLRQIMVSVDITAPLYWWKEFDTYKVGTVANSTSTMHKIMAKEFTVDMFEVDNIRDVDHEFFMTVINRLNELREEYLTTQNKDIWRSLIQLLPESWLQTRTVTLNYQVLRQMYFDRRNHKLTEWSGKDAVNEPNYITWLKSLPYAEELICYKGENTAV